MQTNQRSVGVTKGDVTPQDLAGLPTPIWRFSFAGLHDRMSLRALAACVLPQQVQAK